MEAIEKPAWAAATTNLAISASPIGLDASTNVIFVLEWQGAAVRRLTSAAPYQVTFFDLSPGKYFLSAMSVNDSEASADLSFEVQPASLQPVNDSWAGAIQIGSIGTSVADSNAYARRQNDYCALIYSS